MRFCVVAYLAVAGLLVRADELHAGLWTVSLRDQVTIGEEQAFDQHGTRFAIDGLSGITYLGGSSYRAVMDWSSKVVTLNIAIASDGSMDAVSVADGLSLSETRDFEGIAYKSATNSVYLAEEDTPAVHEYDLATGVRLRTLASPSVFSSRRTDYGFESLTMSSDGASLWTANEDTLSLDGPISTASMGGVVRLLRYDAVGSAFSAAAQFAYELDPVHGGPFLSYQPINGLVDLVALPDGTLLSLERSFAWGVSPAGLQVFRTSIYALDFTSATELSTMSGSIIENSYEKVGKELLWRGSIGVVGMNLEGLTLGPKLGSNRWALVGVVDNGDPLSRNQVVTFEVSTVPESTSLILASVGIVLFSFIIWPRSMR